MFCLAGCGVHVPSAQEEVERVLTGSDMVFLVVGGLHRFLNLGQGIFLRADRPLTSPGR